MTGVKLGNLLARTKALLSRPLERATARSVGPLVATLDAAIARRIDQIEARQHALTATVVSRLDSVDNQAADCRRAIQAAAVEQREAEERLGRTLERLEGQAFRQEQAIQAVAGKQREAEERLGRTLERLEGQATRQEQAIQAVAGKQREAGEGVGHRLERLEAQASRQEQAIQAVDEQQRQLSASVDARLEHAHKRLSELIDERLQKLAALSEQQNNRVEGLQASVAENRERFDDVARKVASLNEIVETLPTLQTLKGLGIEDHLLESYGSAPPLHPIGGWHVGAGIDDPTSLHKDRVRKWNAMTQPALLVWHADLKVMLWPGNENSRALFIMGNFEPSEMSWLADNLKEDMVFLDVGANMGIYTMFAAKLVGAGGRVLAIEPSEREFQRLSFHVVLNDLGNVTCLRLAAADKVGTAELKVAGEEKSGQNTLGRFVTESVEVLRVETVRTQPLDRIVAQYKLGRVDVIKIDVEGAELRVLRGLADTLERWRPKLLIELAPDALTAQETSPQELIEWLRDSRYELFEFSRSTGALQEFENAAVNHGSKNFVAIPS
jgi:FkbM family methyltransferase